jgi:hypothetical protein
MTREYPKAKHDDASNNDFQSANTKSSFDSPTPPPASTRERTKPISAIHDEEIEKARTEIAALVAKARAVEFAREDPLVDRPEIDFINELQAIFKQIHHLNARWLAGTGYEYVPPAAVNVVTAPDIKDAGPTPQEQVLTEDVAH